MKIKTKLIGLFLMVTIIPILIIGTICFNNAKNSLQKTVLNSLKVMAEFKEGEIFIYLEKMKARTSDFASDGFIRDSTAALNDSDKEKETLVKNLNNHLIRNKQSLDDSIFFIDILDLNGRVISSSIPARIGKDKSREKYFILGKERVYIKDMHREDDGSIEIEVAAPLKRSEAPKEVVGVLVNHYNASLINEIMIRNLVLGFGAKTQLRGLGKTGETYVVNKDKIMMNESIFIKDAMFKQKVDTYPVEMCFTENREVTGIWRDYRGVSVAAASMCIDTGDFKWMVTSKQDESEAFVSVQRLKKEIFIYGTVMIFVVFLIAIATASMISKPINNLIRATKRISDGNLEKKIEINSKDEIGELAKAFNLMTKNLRDTDKQLIDKNVKLSRKIDESDKLNRAMIGRELKMVELKKDILNLKKSEK